MIQQYKKKIRRTRPTEYTPRETQNTFFSEKEFIIRASGKTKVFKISKKFQITTFIILMIFSLWGAYSYQLYSVSNKIISYQSKKLGETRNAYVDLMSDFITVHKNISALITPEENNNTSTEVDAYLEKAKIIEDKIKKIAEREKWIDEETINTTSELKDAIIDKEVALSEKRQLEKKVAELEDMIASLQAFELEILAKVESISNSEMNKVKTSLGSVNAELKKHGKYFNPLANSKKNNRGGIYIPAQSAVLQNKELSNQAFKTFETLDTNAYYQAALKKIPLGKPVWSYWLSSPFGKRADPFNTKSATHKGVDLASNKGNKVKSMAEGTVIKAGTANGYGKVIEIDHGNGFKTKYAHLNAIYVNKGQQITQGQAIGEVGTTGRSTGPHLHYEILYDGTPVNPMVFIKAK